MNGLQVLSAQPWVARLGWTLVHFLWQGLAIAILYAAARGLMGRSASANARYLLACAAMAAMMAAPLATWVLTAPPDARQDIVYRLPAGPPAASTDAAAATNPLPASVRPTLSGAQQEQVLLWVVMMWLAGSVVFWARLAGGWAVAARMRSTLVRRAPPEWQATLEKLQARIGLSRPVE